VAAGSLGDAAAVVVVSHISSAAPAAGTQQRPGTPP
jgi:hypothetical protein